MQVFLVGFRLVSKDIVGTVNLIDLTLHITAVQYSTVQYNSRSFVKLKCLHNFPSKKNQKINPNFSEGFSIVEVFSVQGCSVFTISIIKFLSPPLPPFQYPIFIN